VTLEERLRVVLQDPARSPSPDFRDRVLAALPAGQRAQPWSLRWLTAPLGAATVLAIVVLVGSSMTPRTGVTPLGTPSPPTTSLTATPTAPPSATVPAGVATYADGMPREIDREPVLRGDAIGRQVAASQDDTSFLIGGYIVQAYLDCAVDPAAPGSPLVTTCGDGPHLLDGPFGPGPGPRLVHDGLIGIGGDPAVFRVHVNDPRADDCPPAIRERCEDAIVVEEVVWVGPRTYPLDADGIPLEIDGEAVLRGDDISAKIEASQDDTPFLIGGWASGRIMYRCKAGPPEPRTYQQLLPCGAPSVLIMDGPDREDGVVVRAIRDPGLPRPGPVVLRVHVRDDLAAKCPAALTACDGTIVLDEVVWTGP
jgi:hypothetical protein